MEKIKVSKELGMALKTALNGEDCEGDKTIFLNLHQHGWVKDCELLNELSTMQLAEILVKGYEIKKTPDELLKKFETEIMIHSIIPGNEEYGKGAKDVIEFFKENFEIKGINDK